MKLNISRQSIYLLALSVVLLVFVFIFAFVFLIPQGKAYRIERLEMKKHALNETQYSRWHDEVFSELKELQSNKKHIIAAYENGFNKERFIKINQIYFESLKLNELKKGVDEDSFTLYEVNATSKIDSPNSFYSFLQSINKSEWIINVNFPINFEREGNLIKSSFTLKIYSTLQE
jgi:hypothetical protein